MAREEHRLFAELILPGGVHCSYAGTFSAAHFAALVLRQIAIGAAPRAFFERGKSASSANAQRGSTAYSDTALVGEHDVYRMKPFTAFLTAS